MRSSLLALAVVAGFAGLAGRADAALVARLDGASASAPLELVQYYGGRDYRRPPPGYFYREQERRRRQAFRQERWERRHAYGYYAGPRYYR